MKKRICLNDPTVVGITGKQKNKGINIYIPQALQIVKNWPRGTRIQFELSSDKKCGLLWQDESGNKITGDSKKSNSTSFVTFAKPIPKHSMQAVKIINANAIVNGHNCLQFPLPDWFLPQAPNLKLMVDEKVKELDKQIYENKKKKSEIENAYKVLENLHLI